MKNYLKLLAVALVLPLAFSSCKDDEKVGSALIGTWEQVSYALSGCVNPDDNGSFTCSSDCDRIVVTENTITFENEPAESYTATSKTITTTETVGTTTVSDTVNYTITGTTLTITYTDDLGDGGCLNTITFRKV